MLLFHLDVEGGTPYGNNGYNASQYAFFSVQEDKLAVSYFLDHVYRFNNIEYWLRPNLNEPGILVSAREIRTSLIPANLTSVRCDSFCTNCPHPANHSRKSQRPHANCRGFPLSADAAAGLLLAIIEQLVRRFACTTRRSIC